jgi:two-component system invasion response regulator UvrY
VINVMLVDDHDLVRTGIRKILDDVEGIKVVAEARTGEEAIQIIRDREKLRPQVILMDIKMPGIGGFEATKKLLRIAPDIRVLIVTICTNDLYPVRLLQVGASGYLTKGATTTEMVQAIRAVHLGQRYISPKIASLLALQRTDEHSPFELLSERELQVMLMITMGMGANEIAEKIGINSKTVNSYRYRIYQKLKIKNNVELTLLAIRWGLIESEEGKS